ncbi:MAG: hypothetical protein H6732_03150 [Alphaproteobacteria bacterium]|nr:hypothetical protein [Alphaproteobacteria bacterium]
MLRTALIAAALLPATAFAGPGDTGFAAGGDYTSPTQPLVFDGTGKVIDAQYVLPLGFDIDVIIAEFWLGVTPKLTGNSEFGLYVEGLSDIEWSPDDGQAGLLYHDITPVPGSGLAAVQTDVSFVIDFELYQPSYGQKKLLSFPLLTEDVVFQLKGEPFTPFLLPTQTPNSASIASTSTDLAFNLPLIVPVGLGNQLALNVGAIVTGWPVANVSYGGREFKTKFADFLVGQSGEILMDEQLPQADLLSQYTAYVEADIGYRFDVTLSFELEIFGFSVFPIKIPLWGQTFKLFQNYVDLDFQSETYSHPLPMMTLPNEVIDLGNVEVGESADYQFRVQNDGELDLVGVVGLRGDTAFAVSPVDFAIQPYDEDILVITVEPVKAGEITTTLILESNDPYLESREITVKANGIVPTNVDTGLGDNDPFDISPTSVYNSCGCATSSPLGMLPLLGLLPLLALRRRED